MIIEYEEIYKQYVVWNKIENLRLEVFKGTKKSCKEFIRTHKRSKSGKIKPIEKSL